MRWAQTPHWRSYRLGLSVVSERGRKCRAAVDPTRRFGEHDTRGDGTVRGGGWKHQRQFECDHRFTGDTGGRKSVCRATRPLPSKDLRTGGVLRGALAPSYRPGLCAAHAGYATQITIGKSGRRRRMDPGEQTTGTRDEHYNLISVLYHALHGA